MTEEELDKLADKDNLTLLPAIRDKFDQLEGACDYFQVLERENDEIMNERRKITMADNGTNR